jgi:hypothetical protein
MKKFLVLFFAIAMVVAFTVPSYAEFTYSFKGDARMNTYSVNTSKEYNGTTDDDRDTTWSKENILSRFSITAKSENIKGYIEIRPNVGSFVRHWFGEYDFGAGKLLVGKTWAPATFFTNNQNFAGNLIAGYGNLNYLAARVDQIRLTFGDLVIGFVDPSNGLSNLGLTSTDVTWPTVEATYTLKLDPVKLMFAAGYKTYDAVNAANTSFSVDSYFVGASAYLNFGPMYANVEGHWVQNADNYGLNYPTVDAGAKFSGGQVKDNTGYGYLAAVGYKISDMLSAEAGYSHLEAKNDLPGATADDASMMYVMLPITVAPGVTISPELGKVDEGKSGANVDQGDYSYFGATWKIAF